MDAVLRAKPKVDSIQLAPFASTGRKTAFDDDPGRREFGILRECERILKRRGVNVYPSLINSMQKMTARGIALAASLRAKGVPVIESYPGAAQDIMGIVRKRRGLDLLSAGLQDFGVRGEFISSEISHDELDAITSAVVALFFIDGRFEALGNIDEEYLIIPDLSSGSGRWTGKTLVAFSGPISAGKTTLARHLEKAGFTYARYSEILADELRSKGISINRANLQALGEEINELSGQRWLGHKLLDRVKDKDKVVIDGLRFPEDYAFWYEMAGASLRHVYVTSAEENRERRYMIDTPDGDFRAASAHPVERRVQGMFEFADLILENDQSIAVAVEKLTGYLALQGQTT